MKTSRIIIAIVVLALMASQFILASDQEFDIGDGRRLVLHDDGTYEVVHAQVDTSLVVGSQYVIDMDSTMELALEYAILEDPSVALLGKDLLLSMMQETGLVELIEEQIPDFSMIFLDMERVLFTMEGEDPVEYPYRIASDYDLMVRFFHKHKISYAYINKDMVTMRTGGLSTKNLKNRLLITVEDVKACRKNGLYSNILLMSLKYFYKVFELRF